MKQKTKKLLSLPKQLLDRSIIINGTKFDRRRKLSDKDIKKMKKLSKKHSYAEISARYGVSIHAVKYHVDDAFREKVNKDRAKYGSYTVSDPDERVKYKVQLLINNEKLQLRKIGR